MAQRPAARIAFRTIARAVFAQRASRKAASRTIA
jgi:hypothetical protein